MKKVALIVAGGKGVRMKSDIPKQFLLLNKIPILMHTLSAFSFLDQIILILPENLFDYWKDLCKKYNFKQKHTLAKGGLNRFDSVKNGLKKIKTDSIVMIHDGVRPFISKNQINQLIKKTEKGIGVIPIIPVKNSIRKVTKSNSIHIDRSNLFEVQTPQSFLSSDIKTAYTQDFSEIFTDDATVFEYYGGKITSILGEERNLKITTKIDLTIAKELI